MASGSGTASTKYEFRYYRVTRPPNRAVNPPVPDNSEIQLYPAHGDFYEPEEPSMFVFKKANDTHRIPLTEENVSYLRTQGWSVSDTNQPPAKKQWLQSLGDRLVAFEKARERLRVFSYPDPVGLCPTPWWLSIHISRLRPVADQLSGLSDLDIEVPSFPEITNEELSAIRTAARVGKRLKRELEETETLLRTEIDRWSEMVPMAWDGQTLRLRSRRKGTRKHYLTKVVEELYLFLEAKHGRFPSNTTDLQGAIQKLAKFIFGIDITRPKIKKALEKIPSRSEQKTPKSSAGPSQT